MKKLPWLFLLVASLLFTKCLPPRTVSPTAGDTPVYTPAPPMPVAPARTSTVRPEPGKSATAPPTRTITPRPTSTVAPTSPSSAVRAIRGDLANQIARLEKYAPRAGSEGFAVPRGSEKTAFADLAALLAAGRDDRAAGVASGYGYEIIHYTDRGDGRAESFLLRELRPVRRGWGLYVFRIGQARDVIVEASHPLYDEDTPAIAMSAYRALDARAMLIAGAHRAANRDGAADAAHSPQTVFQAVHETLASLGAPVVLQFHGFAASRHPDYPQVVLGSRQETAAILVERLANALADEGIQAGVCDGVAPYDLCGQSNVQAAYESNALFIHIELDESVRAGADGLIAALVRVFQ